MKTIYYKDFAIDYKFYDIVDYPFSIFYDGEDLVFAELNDAINFIDSLLLKHNK